MTSHQTENNAPKNSAPNNNAPAAGHGGHGPHGASEDPQNIYLLKDAPILKALLSLGVPMALGLAITSIYNVVNSYFVGHYGGTEDLAATSYGVPVFGVIMAIAGLFGLGSSTLASRKLGEGQPAHEIHRVTSFALYSALGAGIVAAAIGFILADPITSIMGASGGSYEPTRIYVHLMFLGAPLAIGMFTLEQLVRSEGYAKQSMYGIIVGTVVTCIFDVLFIAIMGMGVAGAGWAMLLANGASMLYYLLFLMRQSENFSANIRDFSLDPAIIKPVVAVGAAELIQSLNLIFAALLLNNLASYGDDTVAAFGLAMRLNMVPEMLCMGLCMGGIPLYAYAYGARNGARVKEALRTATILSVATSAIITIPVLIFRRELLAVVGDASLIDTGEEVMIALMLAAVFNAVSIVFVSWFQASGKGGPAMLMTIGIALLFFPAVYFGNMWFGFKGLTWAFPFTQVLACALGLVLFLATGGAKVPPAEAEVETEGSEDSGVQDAQVSGAQPEQKA